MFSGLLTQIYKRSSLLQIVLLVVVFASFASSLFQFYKVVNAPALQTSKAQANTQNEHHLPDVQSISQLGWFGTAAESNMSTGAGASASNTQLELKGISKSGQSKLAGAFIAEKGQAEHFYKIGDSLPGGSGVLGAVFGDYVEIKNGQGVLKLRFPTPESASGASDTSSK